MRCVLAKLGLSCTYGGLVSLANVPGLSVVWGATVKIVRTRVQYTLVHFNPEKNLNAQTKLAKLILCELVV